MVLNSQTSTFLEMRYMEKSSRRRLNDLMMEGSDSGMDKDDFSLADIESRQILGAHCCVSGRRGSRYILDHDHTTILQP